MTRADRDKLRRLVVEGQHLAPSLVLELIDQVDEAEQNFIDLLDSSRREIETYKLEREYTRGHTLGLVEARDGAKRWARRWKELARRYVWLCERYERQHEFEHLVREAQP